MESLATGIKEILEENKIIMKNLLIKKYSEILEIKEGTPEEKVEAISRITKHFLRKKTIKKDHKNEKFHALGIGLYTFGSESGIILPF